MSAISGASKDATTLASASTRVCAAPWIEPAPKRGSTQFRVANRSTSGFGVGGFGGPGFADSRAVHVAGPATASAVSFTERWKSRTVLKPSTLSRAARSAFAFVSLSGS